ncbi:uncharacterized protein PHACADRAFT_29927 [Phanerochaete carnosa HHB-10118-sp]|uniref:Trafficking protein particle complex II-specific subunit 65 IgD3 domain-containing protein n=1 Tax=Phanerochaete carnosa (strain HHB-10118-sp) TaxID=650164 RepID=K5VTA8_PHACS|nr:uncharacterized protein PHACADRAFT_29927 [Phanerochaete carnosa HHB-10118-sp]EKM54753.1 hypothetical protein PHACADRAFT_29927 [Phanerochaete carnosa HHB-10118-sp]
MTTSFEEIFNNSVLDVVTPEASLGFPCQDDSASWADWVGQLEAESMDRKMAFFDENLEVLLTLRFEHFATDTEDTSKPPAELLSYLAHLQISYEASYITSIPHATSPLLADARPPVPPRSHSMPGRNKPSPLAPLQPSLAPPHPSIFPPHTPHPIPSTTESDRQYVQAQGTLLRAGTWGDGSAVPDSEAFALVWSKLLGCWIAVFKIVVQIAFIPTKVADPLLCLTVSTTLREKPVPVTSARKTLTTLIEASGELDVRDPTTPLVKSPGEDMDLLHGLEEANLLDGLSGSTFADASLMLPSSRVGDAVRKQAFGILTTEETLTSPLMTTPATHRPQHPTLRKSFRKTLRTVSGFRVRMRTVFVPYFMLPQPDKGPHRRRRGITSGKDDDSDSSDRDLLDVHERELLEAGSEEHTVVLCVEVENGGESTAGFSVENVKVTVGGEGAQTRLIGWGETGLLQSDLVFPLLIGPFEQYNLLYAVTFTRSPEVDEFSLARGRGLPSVPAIQDMQRTVVIIISGRPYEVISETRLVSAPLKLEELVYPTATFPSRWNCILDLSPQTNNRRASTVPGGHSHHEAMPTPASPFPGAVTSSRPSSVAVQQGGIIRLGTPGSTKAPAPAVAGSKRFTPSVMDAQANTTESYIDLGKSRMLKSPVDYRSGTSLLNPANQRDPYAQSGSGLAQSLPTTPVIGQPSLNLLTRPGSYLPPSATMKNFARTPTTTYGPLSPPLPSVPRAHSYGHVADDSISSQIADIIPPTPAYPAFPMSPPPSSPHWQGPIANMQSGAVGPSVEIRREKGPNAAGVPRTPGPTVSAAGGFVQMQTQGETLRDVVAGDGPGEPIVVSVGMLCDGEGDGAATGIGKIYPLDRFTLDIFVFNRSSWTRRFEVSYPDRRKQRREKMYLEAAAGVDSKTGGGGDAPGIVPLANRVRIGPLLPSTCQSVRMDFLAMTPGVHSVDTLTLTDVQSGFSMNLRSVIDIVVHEPEHSQEANGPSTAAIAVA